MKRILVLGPSGSGKSTLTTRLAEILRIPAIHLDSYHWLPNWVEIHRLEWEIKLKELLQINTWVMDGNYLDSLENRIERADTVIFLDYGRLKCLVRCVGRLIKFHSKTRPELPEGCEEKMDWEFFKWIWNYPRDICPKVIRILTRSEKRKQVIFLKNDREVNIFLKKLSQ